eukprot:TRINITY_DN4531_c0_g1_i1.p1 TRINITY_DN4531_c0_g1~~TRINITY_DN4531_c0_g1_i1.p1  ORF type:complete len:524 (-),score=95.76 TRINITY_DN4531_c0_g1_i1:19-1590(-)
MTSSPLSKSIQATSLNILTSISFRIFTFLLNIFILRRTSNDVLGIVNVRFNLLDDSILFLSREAFRRSCLKIQHGPQHGSILNVIWLGLPSTLLWSVLLGTTWISFLSRPEGQEEEYIKGVKYILASTVIQSFSEVFFLVGQSYFFVKLRATADLIWVVLRCIIFATAVTYYPENAVSWGGRSHCIATLIYTLCYIAYFAWYCKRNTEEKDFPFKSLRDFAPRYSNGFHRERLSLAMSFYKQGILKMILTEGERYLMTFLDLLSFSEQGVFDAVSNLGSLAARFVFRNVEDGAFLYFNQRLKRGGGSETKEDDKETERHLFLLLRGMSLLGLLVMVFGQFYSHAVLHLYGGPNLSNGIGPRLLRTHCLLIFFLAVNGVAECFVFAKMSQREIEGFNLKMIAISGLFLSSAILLVKSLGAPGFILANMFNFILRIAHHYVFIGKKSREFNPAKGMIPSEGVFYTLLVSGGLCYTLEAFVYPHSMLAHVICGGFVFLGTLGIIGYLEESIRTLIVSKLSNKLKKA